MNWNDMTFRKQAEMVLSNVDGLTEEQIADVYREWDGMEFPDVAEGRTEALAALQEIGMRHLLKSLGRYEEEVVQRIKRQTQERASK